MTAKRSSAPVRAAIYARQSTAAPGQVVAADERHERQIERCRALADLRGWRVVEEYKETASATSVRGPKTQWAAMLSDLAAGAFDVVIAVDLDRLLRTTRDLSTLIEVGAKVVTVDGEIDLASADGEFRATMLAGIARFEGRRKAERQTRANEARRAQGVPTSGRVPYGFRWVPMAERTRRGDPAAYELDPDRAGDVATVYESFLAGVSLGSICRELNESGKRTVPTKSHPEGVPFRPTTLRRMLLSPFYAALLPIPREAGATYDQDAITRADCVPGAWPAIVTPEQWEEAKARLAHPERKTSPGPSRKWLLSGLALCGVCSEPIRAGGGDAGIHSYRCRGMAHFMRRGVPLDDFIERLIVTRLAAPDAADLLEQGDRPDLGALRDERARLSTSIRQAGDDEQDGLIGRAERVRLTKRANARIAAIDEKLRSGVNVEPLRAVVGQADVAAAWQALSLGHKRAILEALMTVVVHSVGQGNRRSMSDEAMARTVTIEWHR